MNETSKKKIFYNLLGAQFRFFVLASICFSNIQPNIVPNEKALINTRSQRLILQKPSGQGTWKRSAKMPKWQNATQGRPSSPFPIKPNYFVTLPPRPNLKGLPEFRASCAQRPSFASRQALLASQTGGLTHPPEPPWCQFGTCAWHQIAPIHMCICAINYLVFVPLISFGICWISSLRMHRSVHLPIDD